MTRSFPFVSEDARRFPPPSSRLGPFSTRRAMGMLAEGHDTRAIASSLSSTEAAVWNAIAAAKGDLR